jgi:hypothetical protein
MNGMAAISGVMEGRQSYSTMPMLYTGGMISRSLLPKLMGQTGKVFHSQIPDVYSGFAVCSIVDSYLFMNEAFAISGRSSHSSGVQLLGQFSGLSTFHTEGLIPFHPDIPLPDVGTFTWSLEALFYESYLQSTFLHRDRLRIDPASQAARILFAVPHNYRPMLEHWEERFAARHNLSVADIETLRARNALRWKRYTMLNELSTIKDYYAHYETCGETPDVFAASLLAARYSQERPNALPGQVGFVSKVVGKRLRRAFEHSRRNRVA